MRRIKKNPADCGRVFLLVGVEKSDLGQDPATALGVFVVSDQAEFEELIERFQPGFDGVWGLERRACGQCGFDPPGMRDHAREELQQGAEGQDGGAHPVRSNDDVGMSRVDAGDMDGAFSQDVERAYQHESA
jgi:hypothetical protein